MEQLPGKLCTTLDQTLVAHVVEIGVGAGSTAIAALQNGKVDCVMTTQPTVTAIQKKGVGTSAIDLATTDGATAAMGGAYPAASVLARTDWVNSHKATVQKVVDALVATMHWINTRSATDIADKLPASFVSNQLVTQGRLHLGPDRGQGSVPPGRSPAGRRSQDLSGDGEAGRRREGVGGPRQDVHQ
ncbi:ABC transporter substrate-binding protein [Streptomyces sp. NPDC054804]